MDKSKKTPINTQAEHKKDPAPFAFLAMALGPDAVVVQERQGQQSLSASDTLPTDCLPKYRLALKKAGAVFGEKVPDDPMFTFVTLPDGWSKRATDHVYTTEVVDAKARVRAHIFYKAAFYDRFAYWYLVNRFRVDAEFCGCKGEVGQAVVRDAGTVVFTGTTMNVKEGERGYDFRDRVLIEGEDWLDRNYPDWRDPAAYWDD